MKCKGPCGGEKGLGKGSDDTRILVIEREGHGTAVEGFALVECGSHIAPLRLRRFAVRG